MQPELLRSTGEGTNCLGSSPHKTSSNWATERETQAKTTEGAAHFRPLRQHETCGGPDNKGRQQSMPGEHTTTRCLWFKQRRVPLSRSRSPLPNKGQSRGEGGDALPAREDAFLRVPQLSPGVSASVFLPSAPVFPPLKTTPRKKSAGPRALVGWEGSVVLACVHNVQAKPRTAHVTQDTGDNERSRHFLGVGLESRGVGGSGHRLSRACWRLSIA